MSSGIASGSAGLLRARLIVNKAIAASARVIYIGTKPEPITGSLHASYREYDALIKDWVNELALAASSTSPPLVMVDSYNGARSALSAKAR
eukprot:7432151-Pyramimonas_sp.AAC.1